MRFRRQLFAYIFVILIGIGIVYQLKRSKTFIIAVIVLGSIFLLYKFPPKFRNGRNNRKPRKRKHTFRVIDGKKNNDDDPPPFH